MSNRSSQLSDTYRSRQPPCSVLGSLAFAAAIPAVIWLLSHPLATGLLVVVVVVVAGVRALRARGASRSTAAVTAATPTDDP